MAAASRTSTTADDRIGGYRLFLGGFTGLVLGFFGSVFSPLIGAGLGGVLAVFGMMGYVQRSRLGALVLTIGAALIVGAGLYILLGVLQPDGPATGSGSSS